MNDRHERFFVFALHSMLFRCPRIAHRLIAKAGSASNLFCGNRAAWRSEFEGAPSLWEAYARFDGWRDIEKRCDEMQAAGIRWIAISDGEYPPMLREIYDPPPVLFVHGARTGLLSAPAVAIVGARKASDRAKEAAVGIARGLSEAGVVVVSGLAYGIDAAAHRGALAGEGGTIAVLGSGIDVIYPAEHRDLARRVAEDGLLVSEFPPGTRPIPPHFPQRNRVISGLALSIVVVEAAEGSGSLITARFALDQGRDVMVCPGMAGDVRARGNNRLLREGALFVECAEDVLEGIAAHLPPVERRKNAGHCGIDRDKDGPLLQVLKTGGAADVDALVMATSASASEVLAGLSRLVVAGAVEELPGRRFCAKKT